MIFFMSIDRGQMEAGRSLGFGYVQTMRFVIVPQAFKNVLPALANEFIALLKETSVAGYVAVTDLTKGGDIIRGRTYSAFMARMFEPFAQENRPEAGNAGGTGIGLTIVKRIVDLLGGTIAVRSNPGEGTRFEVELPVPTADGPAAAGQQPAPAEDALRGKRVLLCEDNLLNREIAEILLKNRGVLVESAENGKAGVRRFAASAPGYFDAVLMDLRMSKAESRKIELRPEPYPFEEFQAYIDAVIRPLCEEKRQTFSFDARPIPGYTPLVDITRLNRIYFNLLSNAVKYTPEGGAITLKIREELLPDERIRFTITVRDNGIGMMVSKPLLRATLVSAFERALGEEKSAERKKPEFDFTGKRVLVAEDNDLNAEIARTLLESKNFSVDRAPNGLKTLEQFVQSPKGYYDAILMDVRMPMMDGLQTTANIRHWDRPDAGTIPIVAMTANAFDEDVEKSRAAGMPEILLSGRRERGGGAVIFQDDAGLAALTVGRVTGIVQLPPSRQFEMPEQARSPKNRWIAGVAFIKSIECLCYLLDRGRLRERFL